MAILQKTVLFLFHLCNSFFLSLIFHSQHPLFCKSFISSKIYFFMSSVSLSLLQAFCIVLTPAGSTWYYSSTNRPVTVCLLSNKLQLQKGWCVCVSVMPTQGCWWGSRGRFGPPPLPARRKLGIPGRRWRGCRSSRGPLERQRSGKHKQVRSDILINV